MFKPRALVGSFFYVFFCLSSVSNIDAQIFCLTVSGLGIEQRKKVIIDFSSPFHFMEFYDICQMTLNVINYGNMGIKRSVLIRQNYLRGLK